MRRVWAFVCAAAVPLSMFACGHNGAVPPPAEATPAPVGGVPVDIFWNSFRQAYPLHAQGVAISDPGPNGDRTLVVAEPPPGVTVEAIGGVDPAIHDIDTRTHKLGLDGWTKDVVAHVSSGVDVDDLNVRLHRALFGTSYHAYLLPISPPPALREMKERQVGPPDLYNWVADTKSRVVDLVDGTTLKPRELLDPANSGVYASNPEGLIVWALPRTNVDDQARECRMFAVDSDLILGAYAGDRSVVIVARRRELPVATYAPIRYESVKALSATGDIELAQSFERTNFAAGKLPEGVEKGWDWAPIYLSPGAVDTEVGSVLNIADQLLKSWSNHGETTYEGFSYQPPPAYPFDKSIMASVKANSITYNWNTRGFSTLFDDGPIEYLNFSDTTALPVTYILADGDDAQTDTGSTLGQKARDAFSTTGDPYLIRAAQYAALYQIVFNFDLDSADVAQSAPVDTKKVTDEHVVAAVDHVANATDAELTAAAEKEAARESQSRAQSDGSDAKQAVADWVEILQTFRDGLKAVDGDKRHALAQAVAASDAEDDQDQFVLLMREVLVMFVDKDAMRLALMNAARKRSSEWIRTPSVVASRNPGRIQSVGGHDVDPMPMRFFTSAQVPQHKVAVLDGAVAINRRDLSSWSNGPLLPKEPPPNFNAGIPAPITAQQLGSGVPTRMVVERRTTEFVVTLTDGANPVRAWSFAHSADANDWAGILASKSRSTIQEVELKGFDAGGQDAFLRTLDVRSDGPSGLRVVEPFPEGIKAKFDDVDLTRADFVDARVEPAEGGSDISFDVAIPSAEAGKPGMVARFTTWFRDLVPARAKEALQGMRDAVSQLVRTWRSRPQPNLADLKNAMRMQLKTVTKKAPTMRVHIKDESGSGFLVERPAPGTAQGG